MFYKITIRKQLIEPKFSNWTDSLEIFLRERLFVPEVCACLFLSKSVKMFTIPYKSEDNVDKNIEVVNTGCDEMIFNGAGNMEHYQ